MNKIKNLFRTLSEDKLSKAVEELESAEVDGVIPDGVVRELANEICLITNEDIVSTHLFMVTVGVYKEAAARWKNTMDLPFFYPLPKLTLESLEIKPCALGDDLNVEVCEEGDEDFWTVYGRCVDLSDNSVDSHAIVDFRYKCQAENFVNFIKGINYKNNE